MLAEALLLVEYMEYPIPTRTVKTQFESLPNSYKVDIASPQHKLAIEVDGNSHKTTKWKFLDKRKEAVLSALGWSVLRFWNQEVTENLEMCVQKVRQFMTLR
jgi:very-short-patch-repair endonuclease